MYKWAFNNLVCPLKSGHTGSFMDLLRIFVNQTKKGTSLSSMLWILCSAKFWWHLTLSLQTLLTLLHFHLSLLPMYRPFRSIHSTGVICDQYSDNENSVFLGKASIKNISVLSEESSNHVCGVSRVESWQVACRCAVVTGAVSTLSTQSLDPLKLTFVQQPDNCEHAEEKSTCRVQPVAWLVMASPAVDISVTNRTELFEFF